MLYFVTTNESKFNEVKRILAEYGIEIKMKRAELLEIQSDDLDIIAENKARNAYSLAKCKILVEDDGLFIDALNGFPGVYSAYVYRTIGNDGILKLMDGIDDRNARFVSVMAYADGDQLKIFRGVTEGIIAKEKRGEYWGYDPIFIPKGYSITYSELGSDKDNLSHRRFALEKFAEWYKG